MEEGQGSQASLGTGAELLDLNLQKYTANCFFLQIGSLTRGQRLVYRGGSPRINGTTRLIFQKNKRRRLNAADLSGTIIQGYECFFVRDHGAE